MSKTKANHLAEITAMMKIYNISLQDIDFYGKSPPKLLKETPRLILFLSYLGGLLMLGGTGLFLKDYWADFNSLERILLTYGMGVALYGASLALFYKKTSTLLLSNLFVISFLFLWGGLCVAIIELFPHGDNAALFVLCISSILLLQTGLTFIKIRLTAVLFMSVMFLAFSYGSLIRYLFETHLILPEVVAGLSSLDVLFAVGSLSFMAVVHRLQGTPYRAICGVWFFLSMGLFYGLTHQMLSDLHGTEFFAIIVVLGLALSQGTRSKAMLTLTALALIGYLTEMTTKYFLVTPWWPLALVSLGLLIVFSALGFYRKSQSFN